jgi:glycerophosphoryl diester phosphodiesterase
MIVHGHRGSRGTAPENTLPSFQDAYDAGAEWVEFDIQFCKDKELVVFHDRMISSRICRDESGRPVSEPIPLRDLSVTALKKFDCGRADAKIPTFRELIEWKLKQSRNLRLNIEIKYHASEDIHTHPRELAENTLKLLREFRLVDESLVQSFDFEVVRALRALDSKVRLSCLFEREADFANVARACDAQVAAVQHQLLDAENVRACQAAGLEVLPWTVNEEKDWQRMVDLGVGSIITDFPKRLKEAHLIG